MVIDLIKSNPFEYRLSGNKRVDSVWLTMRVGDLQMSSVYVFNNLVDIPSHPQLGFDLRLLRIAIIVSSVVSSNVKLYIVGLSK